MQSRTFVVQDQSVQPFGLCGQRDLAAGWGPNGSGGWPRGWEKRLRGPRTARGKDTPCGLGLGDLMHLGVRPQEKPLNSQPFSLASFERESQNLTLPLTKVERLNCSLLINSMFSGRQIVVRPNQCCVTAIRSGNHSAACLLRLLRPPLPLASLSAPEPRNGRGAIGRSLRMGRRL